MGIWDFGSKNSEKWFRVSNAIQLLFRRQMPPGGIGASNATRGHWGVKYHPEFTGASKATPRLLGRQRPGYPKNFEKKSEKLFRASNATQVLFGRQMPPGGIGASNATRGYRGVKCHPEFTGASKARGVKGPNSLMASKIRGVKGPYMGRGHKGHKASEFRESKFGRQGSRRQRSWASKEMNPYRMLILPWVHFQCRPNVKLSSILQVNNFQKVPFCHGFIK